MTLIDATAIHDEFGDSRITGIFRIQVRIDAQLGRLHENDRQLWFLTTHTMLLNENTWSKNPRVRRERAIGRIVYVWLRRESEDPEACAADIETLLPLGRTERWQSAIRKWALIARKDPEMFHQYATYASYAAE